MIDLRKKAALSTAVIATQAAMPRIINRVIKARHGARTDEKALELLRDAIARTRDLLRELELTEQRIGRRSKSA